MEELTEDVKRILGMNNDSCPVGGVLAIAAAHGMENHDPQMIR